MSWVFNPFTGKLDNTGSGGGGGSSTFKGLTDTPSTYTSQAGKALVVNSGETAVDFASSVQAFDGGNYTDTFVDTVDFDGGAY